MEEDDDDYTYDYDDEEEEDYYQEWTPTLTKIQQEHFPKT
jgi:hypothetical protein